jgi:predicted enzyme related to lactoylglutathione lyase
MPTRETPFAPGTPCWVDLLSSDPVKSKAFYGGLLGWNSTDAGEAFGHYVNFDSEGQLVAGMAQNNPESGSPDAWSTYLATADIDATVVAATAAGANVIMPAMAVADLGSMALLIDPAGAAFGLWQAGLHTGFGKYNEPGSVTWDEIHSKDYPASKAFYADVFGWELTEVSDTDDFRYATGHVAGEMVAGLMDASGYLPAEISSHWAVYFSVANVDEACAKVVELGGAVTRPAEDTPYGRLADALDSTGAMFKLHSTENLPPN